MVVQLYTDGACRGNPGLGGWGVVMIYGDHQRCLKGFESHTTNNRMELQAAIKGLEALSRACEVAITTDSEYVRRGITEWIDGWKRKGWRNAKREPVKNQDLWKTLDALVSAHQITWHWVKGHSGHPENEWADRLANEAIDEWLQSQ